MRTCTCTTAGLSTRFKRFLTPTLFPARCKQYTVIMSSLTPVLQEQFSSSTLDPHLEWMFLPPSTPLQTGSGRLELHVPGETDYWQRTHYGFRVHNGPFLHMPDVKGDFVLTTTVTTKPQQRFDQAGLMVQCSPSCWLKTSVESGAPGQPSQLGVVVTNGGFSDWSTQDFPSSIHTVALRVRREGSDYIVEACVPHSVLPPDITQPCSVKNGTATPDSPPSEWTQLRMCHLVEDTSPSCVGKSGPQNVAYGQQLQELSDALPLTGVAAGLYAASPKPGNGFKAEFAGLHILAGRLPGCE